MTTSNLNYVVIKVEKRVPTWQSVGLYLGGKMILVESCLSSVPNYTMGVYSLQEEIHHKMDNAIANFFPAWTKYEEKVPYGKMGYDGHT
jgi:hypothetical protein